MQHMHAAFTHGMASKTYLTYTMPSTGPNLFAPQMIIRTYIVYWSLHSQVEHHQMKWSTNYIYSLCLLDWAVWPWKTWWEALKLNSSSSTPLRLQGHQRCNSSTGILALWRSGCRAWDESRTGKHLRSWRNPFLLPSSTLWISPRKKVPRPGWPHHQFKSSASHFTKGLSRMLLYSGTIIGNHNIQHQPVDVAPN